MKGKDADLRQGRTQRMGSAGERKTRATPAQVRLTNATRGDHERVTASSSIRIRAYLMSTLVAGAGSAFGRCTVRTPSRYSAVTFFSATGTGRRIVRANFPRLEAWLRTHDDIFEWARPDAGAIAYARYELPIKSFELTERIRTQRSVLLVPSDMFGLKKGLRFGFGYDIDHTLKGLSLVDEVLAEVASGA